MNSDSEREPAPVSESSAPPEQAPHAAGQRIRTLITVFAVLAASIAAVAFSFPLTRALWDNKPWIIDIFQQHFAATVGLPGIAVVAFLVVIMFEARYDDVDMEVSKFFKFHGAAGPIVLWALCFSVMVIGVKLLW